MNYSEEQKRIVQRQEKMREKLQADTDMDPATKEKALKSIDRSIKFFQTHDLSQPTPFYDQNEETSPIEDNEKFFEEVARLYKVRALKIMQDEKTPTILIHECIRMLAYLDKLGILPSPIRKCQADSLLPENPNPQSL